jgi:hypothetical protein
MHVANPLITVVRAWVIKAENDLKTAVHTLKWSWKRVLTPFLPFQFPLLLASFLEIEE